MNTTIIIRTKNWFEKPSITFELDNTADQSQMQNIFSQILKSTDHEKIVESFKTAMPCK